MNSTKQNVSELIRSEDGATYSEIAEQLDVSKSTARDHVRDLKQQGEPIAARITEDSRKRFYYRDEVGEHPTNNNPETQEKTRNKVKKTRRLQSHMNDMEVRLRRLLDNSKPPVADGLYDVEKSNEDVVIHRTDAHFGDEITDEYGNVVFSPEIAREREEVITDKVLHLVERQQKAGIEYDSAHLLLGGDMVTGENVYSNQQSEVVLNLDEQIDMAFEVYMKQIRRLAARFDALQVVCTPGNHGELEASYSSGANADRLLYMMLDKAVRTDPNLDNVTFIRSDSTNFTNFYVRGSKQEYEQNNKGWKFHLRHGDDSLEHIGTSSGKERWKNWLLRHEFDQAYRGHYHKFSIDTFFGDVKAIMTGSPKPPDEFEESIAEWTQPTAFLHGVSGERTTTWSYEVSFDN